MRRKEFWGECTGTFLMVLFGCGAVAATTLFHSHQGLFQIAMIWGIAVTLAIYITRNQSCAHFNPAVSIAMVVSGRMTPRKLPCYLLAQYTGAFLAALVVYGLFGSAIAQYEQANNIVRGTFASVETGKLFGEYYQQPGSSVAVTLPLAAAAELFGTFLLVFAIFCLTENCNIGKPSDNITPIFIGLTVMSIICLIAPLTQAGLNPARDFAPRLVALLFGWGAWAMPDAYGGCFWVYILAPVLGGIFAGVFFTKVVEPCMKKPKAACCENKRTRTKERMNTMRTKLILVGGFLGAGKTSLLWKTAELLGKDGHKVGLITNDQATNLVDTTFLANHKNLVREVSGSCFCCNFNGFVDAISYVAEQNNGGITVAEPVGSCTDLSATLMQPLKDKYSDAVDLAPLTVLADPERLRGILNGADSAAAYIGTKQLDEADIILINKCDLLRPEQVDTLCRQAAARWPAARILTASVKTGEGLRQWLDVVMQAQAAGTHLAQVDYDTYADGEAAYGWLNATFHLEKDADGALAAKQLLTMLGSAFDAQEAPVGHVKFLLQTHTHQWIGNLTGRLHTASLRQTEHAAEQMTLTVNARVEMPPEALQSTVLQAVQTVFAPFGCRQTALNCLIPGRPNPTYRYEQVIH